MIKLTLKSTVMLPEAYIRAQGWDVRTFNDRRIVAKAYLANHLEDVLLAAEWVEPESPTLICPRCGHDEFKAIRTAGRISYGVICGFCGWHDAMALLEDAPQSTHSDATGASRG